MSLEGVFDVAEFIFFTCTQQYAVNAAMISFSYMNSEKSDFINVIAHTS